ncbi:MAG: MBOAT family O-acyltransferase [Butyricimonas faecihominis]
MMFLSLPFVILFTCCLILYYTVKGELPETGPVTNQLHLCRLFQHRIPTDSRTHCGNNLLLGALDRDAGTGKQTPESLRRGNRLFSSCSSWHSSTSISSGKTSPCYSVGSAWTGKEPSPLFFFPLGISFYTFQALGYLIDVYWEEEEPERSLPDFMLYMLFFMKFLSGPIERAFDMLPQLKIEKRFDYDTVTYGLKLMLIGLMKKVLIADRLAPHLDSIFASVQDASGAQLLLAGLLYPIELYADFSGYTDMAIGGAMMFGYRLSPNFNRPFVAKTITDFWRRWHMSLSFWVRDYLYQPIAASKRYWGQWGIVYALVVTFVLLGVWHGAGWNYVIYGLIKDL